MWFTPNLLTMTHIFPWKFGGDEPNPSGLLQGCLPKNGIWHILLGGKQLPTCGCCQNRVCARRCPILWAAPLKIWWRLAYPFNGYYRGVCPKTGFGTFYSLVNSSPHVDTVRIWSMSEGAPSSGQLPWKFGGDLPTPSMATSGVFTQNMGFGTKNGIWHILLTGDHSNIQQWGYQYLTPYLNYRCLHLNVGKFNVSN